MGSGKSTTDQPACIQGYNVSLSCSIITLHASLLLITWLLLSKTPLCNSVIQYAHSCHTSPAKDHNTLALVKTAIIVCACAVENSLLCHVLKFGLIVLVSSKSIRDNCLYIGQKPHPSNLEAFTKSTNFVTLSAKYNTLVQKRRAENYMIAIMRRIFLGSILECFWFLVRPSEASSAFSASLRGGAVTGKVGNALDQKGSKALRNLWRNGPAMKIVETEMVYKTKENYRT